MEEYTASQRGIRENDSSHCLRRQKRSASRQNFPKMLGLACLRFKNIGSLITKKRMV